MQSTRPSPIFGLLVAVLAGLVGPAVAAAPAGATVGPWTVSFQGSNQPGPSVSLGALVQLQVVIDNPAGQPALSGFIHADVPSETVGMTYLSSGYNCCFDGTLDGGESVLVLVTYRVIGRVGTSARAGFQVSATPDGGALETRAIGTPSLTIEESVTGTFSAGIEAPSFVGSPDNATAVDQVRFRLTLLNGAAESVSVNVALTLHPDLTTAADRAPSVTVGASSSTVVDWVADIGDYFPVGLSMNANVAGSYSLPSLGVSNRSVPITPPTRWVTVGVPSVVVEQEIVESGPGPLDLGDTAEVRLTLTNTGDTTAQLLSLAVVTSGLRPVATALRGLPCGSPTCFFASSGDSGDAQITIGSIPPGGAVGAVVRAVVGDVAQAQSTATVRFNAPAGIRTVSYDTRMALGRTTGLTLERASAGPSTVNLSPDTATITDEYVVRNGLPSRRVDSATGVRLRFGEPAGAVGDPTFIVADGLDPGRAPDWLCDPDDAICRFDSASSIEPDAASGGAPYAGSVTVSWTVASVGDKSLGAAVSTPFHDEGQPDAPVRTVAVARFDGDVVSIGDASVVEGTGTGGTARFAVTLSRPAPSDMTVRYATALGSTSAGDLTARTGTLSFLAGQTKKTILVPIAGDSLDEGDESFEVVLSSPTGGFALSDARGTGTIRDDDPAATISVADAPKVTERNSGSQSVTFTVTMSHAMPGDISVRFATANGTAAAPGDYQARSGTLKFAAGTTTARLTVNVNGDTVNEVDETFFVVLSTPTGGTTISTARATGLIVDDD